MGADFQPEADQFLRTVTRRNRLERSVGVGVVLLVGAACIAFPSNGWMWVSLALLASATIADFAMLRTPATDAIEPDAARYAQELRRQSRLLRWARVWYVGPLIVVTILFVEGACRLVGEHVPLPIVGAVLAVGALVAIVNLVESQRLARRAEAVEAAAQ
jgi:hypothetical protein